MAGQLPFQPAPCSCSPPLPCTRPAGKFLLLYKRAAHRVVLSSSGDLIVRPSYLERTVRFLSFVWVAFSLADRFQMPAAVET